MALEKGPGDAFGGDFDEFDECGGHFLVCLRDREVRLLSLGVRLVTLGVGLEQELGDRFGGDFGEFDEFGGRFLVLLRSKGVRLVSLGGALVEFGRGFGTGFWR